MTIDPCSDPCDEMVSTGQAVDFALRRHLFDPMDTYDFLAVLWSVDRDTAKRAAYRYCYSGRR